MKDNKDKRIVKRNISLVVSLTVISVLSLFFASAAHAEKIGFHEAIYDSRGRLLPWTSWASAIDMEMNWYLNCPLDTHGYPIFAFATVMDKNYKVYRTDSIPCTQLGMGIISYLKYFKYTGKADPKVLKWARLMGDYLIKETLTPDKGVYPRFTRSTGYNTDFPLKRGAQGDEKYGMYVIEPDKGGIAGYVLLLLYNATGEKQYLLQAIQNADCLAKNRRKGDASHSPWPFRVDAITGKYWGERSGNMVYILRLFDMLIEKGYQNYQEPRDALWAWIRDFQIPAPDNRDSCLWVQFFEDTSLENNRNSWSPLNMARYLIEKREMLDPNWKQNAEKCINFAIKHFSIRQPNGVILMGEQDVDKRQRGGVSSTLGGVAAMFYAAGGGEKYEEIAYHNLNWITYFIDSDGFPAGLCGAKGWEKGSWQKDCHTDVVHNFMDAISVMPEWKGTRNYGKKQIHKKIQSKIVKVDQGKILCHHKAIYDEHGMLLPWTSWNDALEREMNWYLNCPIENGYPRFVYLTFMDGDYNLFRDWRTLIPATQNGTGIISYLKYYNYTGKRNPKILRFARYMGDYLVKESITPDTGKYPRFSRSTGWAFAVPQPLDCGSQGDMPYEVQPDKAGIAGYALVLLYDETKDKKYMEQALQNARVLALDMRDGNETRSPWQFRVDYRTGEGRGEVSGNMSFILRLFDELVEHGYSEFRNPRDKLWAWIVNYQIPNLKEDGMLWVQFFEDHEEPDNRIAWSVLNMARYLIEKKETIDPKWQEHASTLIEFTNKNFTSVMDGILVCGEQDYDKNPWGGVFSTYGAVLAMYCVATDSDEYKALAYQALNYCLYAIDDDGCPSECTRHRLRGVWQEDCHTDKIHNYMDAIAAFPEWAGKDIDKTEQKNLLPIKPPKHGGAYVIAHRGAHKTIPENTLPAYQKAIDMDVDFVEIDIRATKDGKFVSIHDDRIDKYVKGISGKIKDFTLAELRSFDVGSRVGPQWKGTLIPTFEEILDLCKGKCSIYIDLKDAPVAPLIAMVKAHNMEQDVLWYADDDELGQVAKLCPGCIIMPDPGPELNLSALIKQFRPYVVASVWRHYSRTFVETCHKAGAIVIVDENDPTCWEQALEWGTDGIQTDHPEELIEFLEKRRKKSKLLRACARSILGSRLCLYANAGTLHL